jgi:hypothetical protein
LVNLRRALEMAVEAEAIDGGERDWLVREMKACYFPTRSYRSVERLCPRLGPFFAGAALPDLKRSDCGLLMRAMKDFREQWRAI